MDAIFFERLISSAKEVKEIIAEKKSLVEKFL